MTDPSTEIEVSPLTFDQARALTDRIKSGIDAVWQDYLLAFTTKVWEPLDYPSFDAWSEAELKDARALRLNRDQRREITKAAREHNLSERQIASALGVGVATTHRDVVATAPDGAVADVTIGRDGRQRAATRPNLTVVPDEEVVDAKIVEDEVAHPTKGMSTVALHRSSHYRIYQIVWTLKGLDEAVNALTLEDFDDGTITDADLSDMLKSVIKNAGAASRFKSRLTEYMQTREDTTP